MPDVIGPYQLAAFGSLRVSEAYPLADIINKYKINSNFWGTTVTGTGSINHVAAVSGISVFAGGAIGTALLRTHEYFRYQAGKGTRWKMTGYSSNAGNSNSVRQWGQFDDSDGLFFQHQRYAPGNALDIVVRSSSGAGSATIAQKNWNVFKYPDLDPTKGNIYECSYQWLGVGSVSFYVNGVLVHVEEHANLLGLPYMRTAQLPLSVKVAEAGGSAGLNGWTSICSSIQVDGGSLPISYGYAYVKPSAPFALATTETPLISIRPANQINSIDNRTLILPTHATIAADNFAAGADQCAFKFYLNSTLTTGLSWTAVGGNSNVEYDITTTAAGFAAGTLIDVGICAVGTATIDKDLTRLFDFAGRKMMRRDTQTPALDVLTITAKLNAGTGTGACDIAWQET